MPEEKWRKIPGFDESYEISTEGRVRSWMPIGTIQAKKPRVLRPSASHRAGSLTVGLGKRGARKKVTVRSLMRDVWMRGKLDGYVVHHKDGDWRNVRLSNLEYAKKSKVVRQNHGGRRPVKRTSEGGDIVYYSSIKQAAEQNHLTLSGLRKRIINGRIIQGILFEFDDQ